MLSIGLTGSIGSGKSTVSRIFGALAIPVYNADEAGRRLLESPFVKDWLVQKYGIRILNQNGFINRENLAGIVFTNKDELKALNNLIHPLVIADYNCWTRLHHHAPYCLHEAAILVESGLTDLFDKLIVVTAPKETRVSRVIQRDHLSIDQVNARMQNQFEDKELLKQADYHIINDGNQLLIPQVINIHREILTWI